MLVSFLLAKRDCRRHPKCAFLTIAILLENIVYKEGWIRKTSSGQQRCYHDIQLQSAAPMDSNNYWEWEAHTLLHTNSNTQMHHVPQSKRNQRYFEVILSSSCAGWIIGFKVVLVCRAGFQQAWLVAKVNLITSIEKGRLIQTRSVLFTFNLFTVVSLLWFVDQKYFFKHSNGEFSPASDKIFQKRCL